MKPKSIVECVSEISINGYVPFRQDRTANGGGTLIYVADYLTSKKLSNISNQECETVWVEIKGKKLKPIYVCSVYRPPARGNDINLVQKYKDNLISSIDNLPRNPEVFILGDFNCDMLKRNTLTSLVNELCRSKGLTQHVKSPTRITNNSATLIDLALSNSKLIEECKVIELGLSDHSLITVKRTFKHKKVPPRFISTRSFKNFNEEAYLDDLGDLDWSGVLNAINADVAADIFSSNVLKVLNKHAPCVKRRIKNSNPPWVNDHLLHSIRERDFLKKRASQTQTTEDWDNFKKKRNVVNKENRNLKKNYYRDKIYEDKQNSRKLWKTLNEFVPTDKENYNFPKTLKQNGVEITDQTSIANTFNNFFVSIGPKLASAFSFSGTTHISPKINQTNFFFKNVSLSTVIKIISKLDNGKATGLDEIGVRAIKAGSPILSFYLTHIFNLSLSTGCVPSSWKKKRVTPVFKKGDTEDVNNYRPISILPIAMKIFEKIVHRQVSDFLDEHDILSKSQSGFRNTHSTDTAVICVSDYILEELAKGQHVGAVLIDLKKAFDTVDHKILLKKLFCMGVRDVALDWFESYLSNRLQCSVVGEKQSSFLEEGCFGVPQGSVLGPLLFLIYINDIFSCINHNSFCHLYADDTIIIQSAKNPLDLNVGLTSQLSSMSSWFYDNKLTVNTAKTEVIFFGRPNKVKSCKDITPITFQGSQIESTDKVKYLGVIFDEGMTWEDQANKARKNAYFNLNKINKIKNLIDDRIKHLLINALVFPHINYCLSSWGNAAKGSTKKFDSLLRSVDKILPISKNFSKMTDYQRSILAFKAINNLCPTYLTNRFNLVTTRHRYYTRSAANNNLLVNNSLNAYSDRTFLNKTTSVWNSLPADMKLTDSILKFKMLARNFYFNNNE